MERAVKLSHRPPGPVTRKLLTSMRKASRLKVIDLAAWRQVQGEAQAIASRGPSDEDLTNVPRSFALYACVTN